MVSNENVVRTLERIADLMEIRGEHSYGLGWTAPEEREDHAEIGAAAIGEVDRFGASATAGTERVGVDG